MHSLLGDRFSSNARDHIQLFRCQRHIRVHNPCHFAFPRAEIRRWNIDPRPDEILLYQFVGVATCDALQLTQRISLAIDLHPAFCPAEGYINDGAFVRHQRRKCHHFIFIYQGAVTDSTFCWEFVVTMLSSPRMNRLNRSIVLFNRERHVINAVANFNLL